MTPDLFSPLETSEAQGLQSAALAAMLERIRIEDIRIDSVLVARHGRVVLDAYRYPYRAGMRHDMASVTKSVTALVVGAVLADRDAFGMNEPLTPDGITVGDVLSMTAGLSSPGVAGDTDEILGIVSKPDWAQAVAELPRAHPPGAHFAYSSVSYQLIPDYITRVTGQSLAAHAALRLFGPLGVTDWSWHHDPQGRTLAWGGLCLHPRDIARVGQMVLDGGRWGGRQLIPEAWVATAVAERLKTGLGDEGYGYGFWRPPGYTDLIAMQGRAGQQVILSPAHDLMAVITGMGYPEATAFELLRPILAGAAAPRATTAAAPLSQALDSFARTPEPSAPGAPGPLAAPLLGRELKVEGDNRLRLRGLTVSQSGAEGRFVARVMGEAIDAPVGFDGVSRLELGGARGSGTAGIADWRAPDRLRVEIASYGSAMRYIFNLHFQPEGVVSVRVGEATGVYAFETTATPA